jgi:hypothetical protein
MRNGIAYRLQPLVPLTGVTASGLWPTPSLPNGDRALHHVDEWRGRSAYYKGKKVQVDLGQAVKMWPTPTVNGNYNRRGASKTSGDGLATAVRTWPTPTARDYRKGDKPESRRARAKQSGKWHSPNLNDVAAPGGHLNPTWVEWLMGFPLGWTDLEPLETP